MRPPLLWLFAPRVADVGCVEGWLVGSLQSRGTIALRPWQERRLQQMLVRETEPRLALLEEIRSQTVQVQELPTDSLLAFLRITRSDEAAAEAFVSRYGLPLEECLTLPDSAPEAVQAGWREIYARNQRPFALTLDTFWKHHWRLEAMQDGLTDWLRGSHQDANRTSTDLGYSNFAAAVHQDLNEWLELTRLEVVDQDGRLVPYISVFYVIPSLYATLWLSIVRDAPILVCRRPRCGKPFEKHGRQVYCSPRCADAHRKERSRVAHD